MLVVSFSYLSPVKYKLGGSDNILEFQKWFRVIPPLQKMFYRSESVSYFAIIPFLPHTIRPTIILAHDQFVYFVATEWTVLCYVTNLEYRMKSYAPNVPVPTVYIGDSGKGLWSRLPFITTPVGGNGDLADESKVGIKVPFGNERLLATEVTKLWQDRSMLKELGANASKIATRFSWDNVFEEITEVYGSILYV